MIDKTHVCKKCESEFKAEISWEYPLCKECSMKLYEMAEHFWFTEILGYSESLGEFLPSVPKPLFHQSLKSYLTGDPRFEVTGSNLGKKIYEEMKAIGHAEKERLLKKTPAKTMACTKCGKDYKVDGVWQYNICEHCAIMEIMDWGKYWISRGVPLSSQIPPIDVKRYCLDSTG